MGKRMKRSKKWIGSILCFALLIPLVLNAAGFSAFAEDAFSIRNGISWGMSIEDVDKIEKGEEKTYQTVYDYGAVSIWYDEKTVSKFPCEMSCSFYKDKLYLIEYDLEYFMTDLESLRAYTYLENALVSLYGGSRLPSAYDVSEIAMVLNVTGYYDEDETEDIVIWDLEDGTTIMLYRTLYEVRLVYCRSDLVFDFLPADGVYNTDGL